MTKKGFLLGIPISLAVGIPFSFHNPTIATFIGVAIGAVMGGSKKAGGGIGFLCSMLIFLAPVYIPVLNLMNSDGINMIFALAIIGGALFNIYVTLVFICSIIIGILVGHIMVKYFQVEKCHTGEDKSIPEDKEIYLIEDTEGSSLKETL